MAEGNWKDKARARMKEKEQGQYFKAVAHNTVRILPNKAGLTEAPYFEFLAHREVGPQHRFVRCGKDFDTRQGKCWLCDTMIPKLAASEKRSKQAMAEAMKPEEDCMVQIGVYDHDSSTWTGPTGWLLSIGGPKSMWAQVMGLLTSPRRAYDSPKKGYNINFTRTGEGLKTKYGTLEPDDEPSAADPGLLQKLKPFEALVPKYTETEQKDAFFGRDDKKEKDEEEDEEETDTETETEEAEEVEEPDEEAAEAEEGEEGEEAEAEEGEEEEDAAEAEEGEEDAAEAEEGEEDAAEGEEEAGEEDTEEMPDEEELEAALDAEEDAEELEEEVEEEAPPPPKKTVPVAKKAAPVPAKKAAPPVKTAPVAKKAAPPVAKKAAAPAAPVKKAAPAPVAAKKVAPPVKKAAAPIPAKKK